MSAISEWFGIYNMMFRYIRNTYGDAELRKYIDYIGDTAYSDISGGFRQEGLNGIRKHYLVNFIKDGGEAEAIIGSDGLVIDITQCPAYKYMLASDNIYDKPEDYFCECCTRLNSRILHNAGFNLSAGGCTNKGKCRWTVTPEQV